MCQNHDTINIAEVFSSFQGEGIFVGCRQIFVRLTGCNLTCSYCDTKSSQKAQADFCQVEQTPGQGDFIEKESSLSIEWLAEHINKLLLSPHHSVSLTGGEPLCQAETLNKLAPNIDAPLYLETNGTLPDMLDIIAKQVQYISMDIKLPSVLGGVSYWREHEIFLKRAVSLHKNIFVKIVITEETCAREMGEAVGIIAGVSAKVPLIIQPVTLADSLRPLPFARVLPFFQMASRKLADVRIIPQTHKILGVN